MIQDSFIHDIAIINLSAADFAAWLAAQPAEKEVGTAHSSACCPLATWLRATTGQRVFVRCLDIATQQLAPYDWHNEMPEWAIDFVSSIDTCDEAHITAGAALEVLERIQRFAEVTA